MGRFFVIYILVHLVQKLKSGHTGLDQSYRHRIRAPGPGTDSTKLDFGRKFLQINFHPQICISPKTTYISTQIYLS
jgi:hypothetical protein